MGHDGLSFFIDSETDPVMALESYQVGAFQERNLPGCMGQLSSTDSFVTYRLYRLSLFHWS